MRDEKMQLKGAGNMRKDKMIFAIPAYVEKTLAALEAGRLLSWMK